MTHEQKRMWLEKAKSLRRLPRSKQLQLLQFLRKAANDKGMPADVQMTEKERVAFIERRLGQKRPGHSKSSRRGRRRSGAV